MATTGVMSQYLECAVANHVLGGGDYTRPSTAYVGLWTSALADTSDSITGEVAGSGYARASVPNTNANWPSATSGSGTKWNATAIPFGTALANWTTAAYVGIFDAVTAGNLLYYWQLATATAVPSGAGYVLPSASITIWRD